MVLVTPTGRQQVQVGALRSVLAQIREYDRQLRALARRDETVTRLMTIPAIGYLAALAFYSTIEDPQRFRSSEDIGPYLGLTPRVHQSGEIDWKGRIMKTGYAMTRDYLRIPTMPPPYSELMPPGIPI